MRKLLITFGFFLLGSLIAVEADGPAMSYEQKPLPEGPLLKKAPDYFAWQMTYAYTAPRTNSNSSSAPPGIPIGSHLPKMLSYTQTKPIWHAVYVDRSDVKTEAWSDGTNRFEVGAKESDVTPISNTQPGGPEAARSYFNGGVDFPDVDWISRNNYLGTQKGTPFWVFQAGGVMVWIDSTTQFPARWQKNDEVRTFQILPDPSEPLALPTKILALSRGLKDLNRLSHAVPPPPSP
jgi:hypothetical protein